MILKTEWNKDDSIEEKRAKWLAYCHRMNWILNHEALDSDTVQLIKNANYFFEIQCILKMIYDRKMIENLYPRDLDNPNWVKK